MDFLQKREPFAQDAKKIMQAAAMELFTGCITAKSATDIYYLMHRCTHSDKESRQKLNQLLTVIGMLDSTADDVFHAIPSNIKDFEDAVMCETAVRSKIDCIVTRNEKDYANSIVAVYTPKEFIKLLEKNEE
ncbi:MAG: PIN domain-containing protein [Clostridium sp.]|nr:PIN domain-containing protein [Clostridium sp.]